MVGFVGGFAKNKHAFRRIFPSRWGGAAAAYFCHWPAISNRFNTRITVIAFHKSPPRGVGMLRLVNSCAMSRYGISHNSCKIGRRIASRAAAASVFILPTLGLPSCTPRPLAARSATLVRSEIIARTRIASFCVEADEKLAGEGDADDHFFFAGGEQPVAEVGEAVIVAGGDVGDEEEDRADAGAAAADGSLALSLAAVVGDRGEAGELGNGLVGVECRSPAARPCSRATVRPATPLIARQGIGELRPQRIVVDHARRSRPRACGIWRLSRAITSSMLASISALIERCCAALLLDREIVGDLAEPCYQGLQALLGLARQRGRAQVLGDRRSGR